MDSKNSGRRRNFLSSQTTKLSKLSLNKKTKDKEADQDTSTSLFDSPFLSKSCRYIDIGSAKSKCSTETSKSKSLDSTFPSGNFITETPEGVTTEEQAGTSEVLGEENVVMRNAVSDDNSENLLNANSAVNKSVAVAGVSEQNQTPPPAGTNKSEAPQTFESVTFDSPDYELNLCDLVQDDKRDGELKLKKEEANETAAVAADDFNLNPAEISVSACPLCWKKFEKKTTLFSHMKTCANSHNVSTRQLLNALDLQNKQAAEREAIGLPAVPLRAPPTRKSSSARKSVYNGKDPNLELALALSVSMKEAKALEIEKETDVLLEAGLGDEAMERQKSLLEQFGFTSSKAPVLESCGPKYHPGSKKFRGIDPLLQTRSQEERERLITEKVAIILMDEDCGSSSSSSEKRNTDSAVFKLNSKLLKKLQDVERTHWQISYASEEVERSEYYVKSLHDVIPVCSIESGSKLKQLTEIPCREKTPEKGEQSSNCYYNESANYENSSEAHLFEFVEESSKHSEQGERGKFQPASSECNIPDAEKFSSAAPPSLLLANGSDSFRKGCLLDWESMVDNETMSDVAVYTKDGGKVCAHKLVFHARCSRILDNVSEDHDETGRGGIISWGCVTREVAVAFLTYLYCGDVKRIADLGDRLEGVKYLAERYNVTELLKVFAKLPYACDADTVERKQDAEGTSNLFRPSEDTRRSSPNGSNLETSLAGDGGDASITAPKSPDLFEDHKMFGDDGDDLNRSGSSNSGAGVRSDLDFLASMLCKPTPTISSPETKAAEEEEEEDLRDVSVSQVVSKDLTEDLDLSRTPGKGVSVSQVVSRDLTEDLNLSRTPGKGVSVSQVASRDLTEDSDLSHTPAKEVSMSQAVSRDLKEDLDLSHTPGSEGRRRSHQAKRHLEVDSSDNEYKSEVKKVCTGGDDLGVSSSTCGGTTDAERWDDLVDLTQTSSDSDDGYEDGKTSSGGMEGGTTTKQVTSPEFPWKGGGEADEIGDLSPDKVVIGTEELSGNELAVGSKYDSPGKVMEDYEPGEATSPANISYPEYDLYGYNEYEHLFSNDELSDHRSPVKSPKNPGQGTENETESQVYDSGSDDVKMVGLSQRVTRVEEETNNSPSLSRSLPEEVFKSPCVPNAKHSPNLLALLDDSFAENLANSSLLRQGASSAFNSPGVPNGSEEGVKKQLGVSEGSEHRNDGTPDSSKVNQSPSVTPMPDYSTMKTPVLKKELSKYGLKALKRRQAKLILRHIYNELHPLVPIENVAGRLDRKGGKSQDVCEVSVPPAPRSPVKRNLLTNMGDAEGTMETEASALSGSESSESSSSSENELDVGDDTMFAEAEEWPSQEEGPASYDLPRLCQEFIQNNPELHQKILLYEPIWLDEMYANLKRLVPKIKLNALMDYLDEQCITFRTSSQRQRRRKNPSKVKTKRTVAKAGRTAKSKKSSDNLNTGCS